VNRDLLAARPHPSKQISDAIAGDPATIRRRVGDLRRLIERVVADPDRRLSALVADVQQVPTSAAPPAEVGER
jgi:hypothetical protein